MNSMQATSNAADPVVPDNDNGGAPVARSPAVPTHASKPSRAALVGYSPNVINTLCYTFVDGACYSLWGMLLLPLYLEQLTSVEMVGLVTTVSGVAQLAGAVTIGYVADRQPRQVCIRAGAVCAAAALATFLCAFGVSSARLVFAGQALWGLYTGVTSTSVEALFADSVTQGRRVGIYNTKWILQTLCYLVGYAAAAAGLLALGHNKWELGHMRAVLVMGVLVHPIALVPLWWLSDRYAVPETVKGRHSDDGGGATAAVSASLMRQTEQVAEDDLLGKSSPTGMAQRATASTSDAASNGDKNWKDEARGLRLPSRRSLAEQQQQQPFIEERGENHSEADVTSCTRNWKSRLCARPGSLTSLAMVPYWMCFVDLLLSIGSGMFLPFFPLFLAADRGLSPMGLYGVYIAATLLTAATSSLLPWLIASLHGGRIPVVMALRLVGTTALFLLATAPRGSPLGSLPASVAFFLCRHALMNSVFGVTRSVIMDCVARHTRAKWSAFESVTSLSWAGSAAVGGWVTGNFGYQVNFTITALVQLMATLLMIPAALGARELEDAAPPTVVAAIASEES